MPEGDSIRRLADELGQSLPGAVVEAAASTWPGLHAEPLVGRRVASCESRGKHLLVHFDDGSALRVHLGLHGRVAALPSERMPEPGGSVRLVLGLAASCLVCKDVRSLELLPPRRVEQARALSNLGPDLLAADFDEPGAVERLGSASALPIGEALMDQRLLAGIGNVYKSEVLFMARGDPFAPISAFSPGDLARILGLARRLLRLNSAARGPRRTANPLTGSSYHVYRREGQPCFVCGGTVERAQQGNPPRSTYFCPNCQRM